MTPDENAELAGALAELAEHQPELHGFQP